MSSPALNKFETAMRNVIGRLLNGEVTRQQAGRRIRDLSRQLYREGVKEEYAHIKRHLDAALADGDIDRTEYNKRKRMMDRGEADGGHLPNEIVPEVNANS